MIVCLWFGAAHSADPVSSPDPWPDYFGLQDREAQWASFRRGIVRNGSGWALVKDTEPGSALYASRLREMADRVKLAAIDTDLVMPIGAVLSGRDAAQFIRFTEMIEKDAGETWKTIIKDQARAASAVAPPARALYWQIDNEINNRHMVASAGKKMGWRNASSFDDKRLIEVYAEYVLAPSIEGLLEVRQEEGVPAQHARIMLGSIANATRESSEDWANDLLGYEFQGRFATSLRGRRVADVVEIVSLHYVATRDEDIENGPLARIYDRWVGDGSISGVWITEELGKARARKNLGALTAIRLMAGYTRWVTARSISANEVRCSFWGATAGDPDATAVHGLDAIFEFMGKRALVDVSNSVSVGGTTAAARNYGFETEDRLLQMILVIGSNRDRENAVSWIKIYDPVAARDIRVYEVSAEGLQPITFELHGAKVILDQRVKIGPAVGVLALVNRQPADSETQ